MRQPLFCDLEKVVNACQCLMSMVASCMVMVLFRSLWNEDMQARGEYLVVEKLSM